MYSTSTSTNSSNFGHHNSNSTHHMGSHHAASGSGETRVPFMITLEALMLGLAITATVLRTRLRRRSMGRLRVEDWCCIGATFILVNMVMVHGFGIYYGIGRHLKDVCPLMAFSAGAIKAAYVARILYPFATGLIRQSVLFLLIRLFPYKTFRKVVISMMAINVCTSLVSCGVTAFQCVPISYIFYPARINLPGSNARCLDSYGLAVSVPSVNLGLDIAVALLPVRMILAISLPMRSKAMILVMLGLGALACVASGVRLMRIHDSWFGNDPTCNESALLALEGAATDICLWATAEVTIGLVCINAPALRPLLRKFQGGSSKSSHTSSVDEPSRTRSNGQMRAGGIALGHIQRPEKAKARAPDRNCSSSSVEQFRPDAVDRTITEIGTTSEADGYCHEGGCQDHYNRANETRAGNHADSAGCDCTLGILRKMEVAVTVSDRV